MGRSQTTYDGQRGISLFVFVCHKLIMVAGQSVRNEEGYRCSSLVIYIIYYCAHQSERAATTDMVRMRSFKFSGWLESCRIEINVVMASFYALSV